MVRFFRSKKILMDRDAIEEFVKTYSKIRSFQSSKKYEDYVPKFINIDEEMENFGVKKNEIV